MGKYFGTDGFRGEAGITLTADHAYKVGRFLGWYYNMIRERNKIKYNMIRERNKIKQHNMIRERNKIIALGSDPGKK